MKTIRALINTIRFIANHPLNRNDKVGAIAKFVKWQIYSRLNPHPIVFPFAQKSKLMVWRGLHGATGNIYCGLHEFEDMIFLLHFLRQSDQFIDIGANVGSYTILSASEVGAKTTSVEPIPDTYKTLTTNVMLNGVTDKVVMLNMGFGSSDGRMNFTSSLDTINRVATSEDTETINVVVDRFDNQVDITTPTLVKIDVEGFETEVINGMANSLSNPNLKGLIVELIGSGKRYGYDEQEIHNKLIGHGFRTFSYNPYQRVLIELSGYGHRNNNLYLRDLPFVRDRVETARKFKIKSQSI